MGWGFIFENEAGRVFPAFLQRICLREGRTRISVDFPPSDRYLRRKRTCIPAAGPGARNHALYCLEPLSDLYADCRAIPAAAERILRILLRKNTPTAVRSRIKKSETLCLNSLFDTHPREDSKVFCQFIKEEIQHLIIIKHTKTLACVFVCLYHFIMCCSPTSCEGKFSLLSEFFKYSICLRRVNSQ